MNISLPDKLKSFVDHRVEHDGYGTASEYVRELIRDDQERKAQELLDRSQLEKMRRDLQAGLDALREGKFREYDSPEALVDDIRETVKNRSSVAKRRK